MRVPKVIIDFSKLTDGDLDQLAQAIVLAMTGNANFTTPDPTLASVTTANTEFQVASANALTGGAEQTAIKRQKRVALEDLLGDLGLYVEMESNEDEAIMLSSGFRVSKQPTPTGPLPKPTGFEVKPEGKGEIALRCNPVKGAKIYQFEYKQVAATSWTLKSVTKRRVLLTDLESGKEYMFRIVPIGTSDVREYSDVISSFVL